MRVENREHGRELRHAQREQQENLRLVEDLRKAVQQRTSENNALRIDKTAFDSHMEDFQNMQQRMTVLEEQRRQAEQRLAASSSLSRSKDKMAEANKRPDDLDNESGRFHSRKGTGSLNASGPK